MPIKKRSQHIVFVCLIILSLFSLSAAKPTTAQASELTPHGAERQANQDGSIGPWLGGQPDIKNFGSDLLNEKPLFQINQNNLSLYQDKLPLGLKTLIENYPQTMKINVYKSYRPAYYPDWLYKASRANVKDVIVEDDGNTLLNTHPGIPFIEPTKGYEVIWNHLLAYKGGSFELDFFETTVYGNKPYFKISSRLKLSFEYYNQIREVSDLKSVYAYYLNQVNAPPKMAGNTLLVHEKLNPYRVPRQAWGYFAGGKKVLRLPAVEYDAPMVGSESIRFADEVDIYNGSIDRYKWKIIGKRELIIPYNNNYLAQKLFDLDKIEKDLLTPYHINPKYLRYEKHRVWVVEGELRPKMSHPYKRRVFYIDEDSWLALVAENYDKNDELWRVSVSYSMLHHDIPGIFKVVDTFHELKEQAYYIQALTPTKGKFLHADQTPLPKREFKPSALRRMGKR